MSSNQTSKMNERYTSEDDMIVYVPTLPATVETSRCDPPEENFHGREWKEEIKEAQQRNEEEVSDLTYRTGIDPPEFWCGVQEEASTASKNTGLHEELPTPSKNTRAPEYQIINSIKEGGEELKKRKTSSSIDQGSDNTNTSPSIPPNEGGGDEEENLEDEMLSLPHDTFSLLLVSESYTSVSFWYGVIVFLQQLALLCAIVIQQLYPGREKSTTLNMPYANSSTVQLGQLTAVMFSLFTQHDLLQSIPVSIALIKEEKLDSHKTTKQKIQNRRWFRYCHRRW